jgi:hypothetical protein
MLATLPKPKLQDQNFRLSGTVYVIYSHLPYTYEGRFSTSSPNTKYAVLTEIAYYGKGSERNFAYINIVKHNDCEVLEITR